MNTQLSLKPYTAALICISTDAINDINTGKKSTYFVMRWQSTDRIPLYSPALFFPFDLVSFLTPGGYMTLGPPLSPVLQ